MKGMAAIAWRELVERRQVLAAAAVAAVLPLVAPLLPGASGYGSDARDVTAWAVAALITVVFGLLLGGSALAPDLVQGRLGFYLARPVSALAVWAGKVAAAFGLVIASAAIIVAVPMTLGLRTLPLGWSTIGVGWTLLALVGAAAVTVAAAHAVTVIWQVRSRWLVLDLIGAVVVGGGVWWAVHQVTVAGADDLVLGLGVALGLWLLVALLAAGALATVRGRTEQLRTHRVLSLTLWSLLALGVATADGYALWVASPTPADLVEIHHVRPIGDTGWVAVGGVVGGRGGMRSAFLVQAERGLWLRMGTGPWGTIPELAATSDGRWAVWSERLGPGADADVELYRVDLAARSPRPEATGITLRALGWISAIAPAPDGGSVAVLAHGALTVYRLPGGAIEVAVAVPDEARSRVELAWTAPDRVRLWASTRTWYEDGPAEVWIWELVPSARRLTATGTIAVKGDGHHAVQVDPEGERLLLWQSSSAGGWWLTEHDARTGAVLGRGDVESDEESWKRTLSGGREVVVRLEDGRATLERFPDGIGRISLGPAAMVRLGGEAAPGIVLVGLARELTPSFATYTTYAVDLASGEVRAVAEGVAPPADSRYGVRRSTDPGSLAARLLVGDDVLEVWDPATGDRRVIAGRR